MGDLNLKNETLVCNDGPAYASRNGAVRVTNVLDNLINDQSIPPTAAIFISSGWPKRLRFKRMVGFSILE